MRIISFFCLHGKLPAIFFKKKIVISTVFPLMNNPKSYPPSTFKPEVARHSPLHYIFISLKKAFSSKRDHQEKRPQDGKTNPME